MSVPRPTAADWERAKRDASLGVGHIWTNQRCHAYYTLNPHHCTCQAGKS